MSQTQKHQPVTLSDAFLAELVQELDHKDIVILRPMMSGEHLAVAEQTLEIVKEAVDELPFSEKERQWLKNWT